MAGLTILFIDDSADDAALFVEALRAAEFTGKLDLVRSVEEGIAYLGSCGNGRALPGLIVLDYRLERTRGIDFLEWARFHPLAAQVPVVVVSGVAAPADVQRAYTLGARTFFLKPLAFTELIKLVERIVAYWTAAIMPQGSSLPRGGIVADNRVPTAHRANRRA